MSSMSGEGPCFFPQVFWASWYSFLGYHTNSPAVYPMLSYIFHVWHSISSWHYARNFGCWRRAFPFLLDNQFRLHKGVNDHNSLLNAGKPTVLPSLSRRRRLKIKKLKEKIESINMVKLKVVIGVLGILACLFWQAIFGLAQLPHAILGTFSPNSFLPVFLKTPSFWVTLSSQIYHNIFPCIHMYR